MIRRIATLMLIAITATLLPAPATAGRDDYTEKPAYALWSAPVVKVYLDPTVRGRGWNIDRALRTWRAGPVHLKTISDPGCTGCITLREIPNRRAFWGEATWQRVDGEFVQCDITLTSTVPRHRRANIAAHELGHCLGLPHINDRTSLMDYWGRMRGPIPTRRDVKWLRVAYGA